MCVLCVCVHVCVPRAQKGYSVIRISAEMIIWIFDYSVSMSLFNL